MQFILEVQYYYVSVALMQQRIRLMQLDQLDSVVASTDASVASTDAADFDYHPCLVRLC